MRFFLILLFFISAMLGKQAYGQVSTNNIPSGYSADISKPEENVFEPDNNLVSSNTPKVSSSCNAQWKAYCQPIRECVEGDAIIPSKDNKILSYLFNNSAETNATLSILGWENNKCRIDFKEGSLVKSCAFSHRILRELMSQLLNPNLFDPNSIFAQNLASSC